MIRGMQTDLRHYVGVTGVSSLRDCSLAVQAFRTENQHAESGHALMTGFLVSPSTIDDNPPINTDKPFRHVQSLQELIECLSFVASNSVVGMVHFELSKGAGADPEDARHVVALLHKLQEHEIAPAVQLNGVLSAEAISFIANETGAPIVFQLREEHRESGLPQIVRLLDKLQGHVNRILLDPSAGSGKEMDLGQVADLRHAIESALPGVFSYGYAGGLGPDAGSTARIVAALRRINGDSDFSVDAESRVRTASGGGDRFDVERFSSYLRNVFAGFKGS